MCTGVVEIFVNIENSAELGTEGDHTLSSETAVARQLSGLLRTVFLASKL